MGQFLHGTTLPGSIVQPGIGTRPPPRTLMGRDEGSECGRMVGLRNLNGLRARRHRATMKEEVTSCAMARDRSVASNYCDHPGRVARLLRLSRPPRPDAALRHAG